MTRVALSVEYDGAAYHGWQAQKSGVRTVQDVLEKALSSVADHTLSVVCAGRTDTGVHGTGQVVHFDSNAVRTTKSWVYGANANLPDDVCVRWAKEVPDDFHARFSATARRYRYVIYNHTIRPALFRSQVTWNYRPLDYEKMSEAISYLKGTHDFTSYRAVHCQAKSPVKTIHHIALYQCAHMLVLEVEANAFLMHMVRNIAGMMMAVGTGKRPPVWAKEVLDAQDRTKGGVTAPPFGLYLVGIQYPEKFALPADEYGPSWLPHDLSDWVWHR